jgi:hypothetical protein
MAASLATAVWIAVDGRWYAWSQALLPVSA